MVPVVVEEAVEEESDDAAADGGVNRLLMGEIVPGLWIGSICAVQEIQKLSDRQWTVVSVLNSQRLNDLVHRVLDALREEEQEHQQQEPHHFFSQHDNLIRDHVEWDLSDTPQADFISDRLEQVLQQIDQAMNPTSPPAAANNNNNNNIINRACLVHCALGVSRSAAICAAWLISRKGHSLRQALDTIRKVRAVSPNLGFLAGLLALEQSGGDVERAKQRLESRKRTR